MYNYLVIRGDIKKRDFKSASKKILNYISFSQKISKGKNKMLEGIYNITELTSSKTYTQQEFNQMEAVYIEINKITDDIYMNHVWLARSLADNNIEKSIFHLNKALNLSKSSEEAYREVIRIYFTYNKDEKLINAYCKNYFFEMEGSTKDRDYQNFFEGNYTFSIVLNDNYNETYSKNLNKLENYSNYQISFENLKNLNKISIVHNFFSGSKISLKNIVLSSNKSEIINMESLNYDSFSSYILDQSEDEVVFVSTDDSDQIINFYLKKEYKDVEKISFDLKLKKLSLMNNFACSEHNEN